MRRLGYLGWVRLQGYPHDRSQAKFNSVTEASDRRGALKLWLQDRLTESERAKVEWRQLWEATWDHLLITPVRELIDGNAAKVLADRLADPETVKALARPVLAGVARALIADLRTDDRPVKRLVPADALDKLKAALSRPGLIHPEWVRVMLRGEAVEAVVSDALYGALKDFSTLLPRVFVKLTTAGRFGVFGGAGAFAEKMIGEVEKMIEPEIRSFLAERTEEILESAVNFAIAKMDEPSSIEFRTAFIDFVLLKSPAFLIETTDDELIDELGVVLEMTALHLAAAPETRDTIHGWIDRVLEECADKTFGEVLQWGESNARPPIDALADATWQARTSIVTSPALQTWMDELLDELIDEYERNTSG